MHHKKQGMNTVYEHVTIHHNFFSNENYFYKEPRDYYAVLLPSYVFLGFLILISTVGFGIAKFAGHNEAWFFALIAFIYYWLYEVMHFAYHSRSEYFKFLPAIDVCSQARRPLVFGFSF
jgi:hypothetical protein